MDASFLARHIRRCNRNLLLTNLVLLAALLTTAFLARRYLLNFIVGPVTLEKRDLRWNLDADQEPFYFVTVDGDKAFEAGYKDVEQRLNKYSRKVVSESTKAYYVPLLVNDRLLLVKSTTATPGTHVTGELVPVPAALRNGFIVPTEREVPELQGKFLPYMLDATGFRLPGWIGLGVGLPLLGVCLWNLRKVFRRMTAAEPHPIARDLGRFGEYAEVEAAIAQEVAESVRRSGPGGLLLTQSWMFRPSTYGLVAVHANELVWMYQKTTKHSWNFIPTGKTHAAVICHHRGVEEIEASEPGVQKILEDFFHCAPWILVGYTDELANIWQRDAGGMAQAVLERRQQFLDQLNAAEAVPAEDPPAPPAGDPPGAG